MLLFKLLIALILAFIIAIISLRFKFLTKGGSVAQFILATIIFGLGGLKWSVPIIVFFFLSSILSRARNKKNKNVEIYFEKSDQRDQFQVLVNGGLGGLLVLLAQVMHVELLYYIYVSSLASVCADTWATEIGTLRETKTINILNFKTVEQGSSGGISLNGILGALLGAFIIPLSSLIWIGLNNFNYVLIITVSGFGGSIVDSILGASVQAQFYCSVCGKITERKIHCLKKTSQAKGIFWINNDVVNFAASLAGGFFFVLFRICLKV